MKKKRKRNQKTQELTKKRKIKEAKSDHDTNMEKRMEESHDFSHKLAKETHSMDKFEVMNQQMREIQTIQMKKAIENAKDTEYQLEKQEQANFKDDESFIERNAGELDASRLVTSEDQFLSILDQVLIKTDEKQKKKQQKEAKSATTATTTVSSSSRVAAAASGVKSKAKWTRKMAIHCDYVGVGEYGHEERLAQVCLVNELNECVYLQRIKLRENVTDYRTSETGLTGSSFDKQTKTLDQVKVELLELLADGNNAHMKKTLIGHNLTKFVGHLFGKYNVRFQRDIARFSPVYKCALPRTAEVANVTLDNVDATSIPDELAMESLSVMSAKFIGVAQEELEDPVLRAQCAMRIYKMFEKEFDSFFIDNPTIQTTTADKTLSGAGVKKKEKVQKSALVKKEKVNEVKHRVSVRKQLDNTIDSLLQQMKGST